MRSAGGKRGPHSSSSMEVDLIEEVTRKHCICVKISTGYIGRVIKMTAARILRKDDVIYAMRSVDLNLEIEFN